MNGNKLRCLIPPLNDCDSILHIDLAVTVYIAAHENWDEANKRVEIDIYSFSRNASIPASIPTSIPASTGAVESFSESLEAYVSFLGLHLLVLLPSNPDPTINDPPIIVCSRRSACSAVYITLHRLSFLNPNLFTPFFPYLTYLASLLGPQA